LKAILIHYIIETGSQTNSVRLNKIIQAVASGGIVCKYLPLRTRKQLLRAIEEEQPDICFSSSYYLTDENNQPVNVHRVLESIHLPYIGSSPQVMELVLSKYSLKVIWEANGIRTPKFMRIVKPFSNAAMNSDLNFLSGFPYILKPDREGNSRGLDDSSIVFDRDSLQSKLNELLEDFDEILIEQYLGNALDIREFTVAMIGNGKSRLLMPAEITLKHKKPLRLVTTVDKDNHLTRAIPVSDIGLKEEIIDFASQAFLTAGVRDYARCDILRADGKLYALEINGQPMIPDKWFEICSSGAGLDNTQYINAIFFAGILRNIASGFKGLKVPESMTNILPADINKRLLVI